jgi:hypothetical protein
MKLVVNVAKYISVNKNILGKQMDRFWLDLKNILNTVDLRNQVLPNKFLIKAIELMNHI